MHNAVLIITTITTALIAGLMYGYSCSVNPGLGNLTDTQYVAAMQSINIAIINPLFMMSFMGTLFLLPLSTWLHYGTNPTDRFYLLLLATVIYVAGMSGVTFLGNIPLNNMLAKFDLEHASAAEIHDLRVRFEGPWNGLHRIRSIAASVALLCVIIACLCDKDQLRNLSIFR